MFFESHAHYDDKRFRDDRKELLSAMQEKGIDYIINCGSNMRNSKFGISLAEEYDFIYAAVGVHPHNTSEIKDEDLDELLKMSRHAKVVAIGEIGLDFHYDFSPRDVQRKRFKDQLTLCRETGLPVIIHEREAAQETFDIIEESGVRKGVVHCFSSSPEMAMRYVNLGFYIGIGGVVTYKNAKNVKEVALQVPLDRILLETDSPYLTPHPFRGNRNDSQYLVYIAEEIGQIRQKPMEEIASITMENGLQLFDIK